MRSASSWVAAAAPVVACAALLAGCGGESEREPAASEPGKVDAAALLRDGMLNFAKDGQPASSGHFRLVLDGEVLAPKDKDVRSIDGKLAIDAAIDQAPPGADAPLPPFSLRATADGTLTQPGKKSAASSLDAGASFIDGQFYARWDGKDYAAGEAISKQILSEYDKEVAAGKTQAKTPSPTRLLEAMDLQPETWLTDPVATDGATFAGAETYKVTGTVDEQALVDDMTEGLAALPRELPESLGLGSLRQLRKLSARERQEIVDAITEIEVTVWIGKEDRLQHRLLIDLDVLDDDPAGPVRLDARLDLATTKLGEPQELTAPAQAAPITDLLLQFQGRTPGGLPGLGG